MDMTRPGPKFLPLGKFFQNHVAVFRLVNEVVTFIHIAMPLVLTSALMVTAMTQGVTPKRNC